MTILRILAYLIFTSAGAIMGWCLRGLIEMGKFEEEERDRAIAARIIQEQK